MREKSTDMRKGGGMASLAEATRWTAMLGWLLLWPSVSAGTSVSISGDSCPICGKTFIEAGHYSYVDTGDATPDLRTTPAGNVLRSSAVPIACMPRWGPISTAFARERKALADALQARTLKLLPEERQFLQKEKASVAAELLLARTCDRHRRPSPARALLLARALYYQVSRWQGAEPAAREVLLKRYRHALIALLGEQLAAGVHASIDEVLYTYLMGELCRLDGQPGLASAQLRRSLLLADRLPSRFFKKEYGDDSVLWLKDLAARQLLLTRYETLPAGELEKPVRELAAQPWCAAGPPGGSAHDQKIWDEGVMPLPA